MIAVGAGKMARIPENDVESVKEQIVPFSFLSLEEEGSPVQGAAIQTAQPEQGTENPVEPEATKQQKKHSHPKKEAKQA
jgi:hypothetical protein